MASSRVTITEPSAYYHYCYTCDNYPMRHATLAEWLVWLEQLHPTAIELGLERIATVADRLAILPLTATVVTVAGTNGKGSTIAAIAALLRAGEHAPRLGIYTSPHLQHFCERIELADGLATERQVCDALQRVDDAREGISLTYFEYTTLAALVLFASAELDIVLLEVGLGGRLDAVNIVDADMAVITAIALDHQHWLGDSREAIGREKAGVLRAHRPVFIADPDPPDTVLEQARELACTVHALGPDFSFRRRGDTWSWRGRSASFDDLPSSPLPLTSWAAALAVVEQLQQLPDTACLHRAVLDTALPGRMQRIDYRGRTFLLDVAHNPHAVARLARHFPPALDDTAVFSSVLFAAMRDKANRHWRLRLRILRLRVLRLG